MTTNTEVKTTEPSALAEENERRLTYARRRSHDKFVADATERFKFFFSEQWTEKELAALNKTGRPALTINKIQPIIVSKAGEYLANRMQVKCIPAANGTPETADSLNKLMLDILNDQDYDSKELELFLEGNVTSRAYLDVRMDFDTNERGQVCITSPNCKNVIPDPDADSYDPDQWNDVLLVSRQTIQDIERNYGKELAAQTKMRGRTISANSDLEVEPNETFGSDERYAAEADMQDADEKTRAMYLVVERQFKSMEEVDFFVNGVTGEAVRVPVDWPQELIDEHRREHPDLKIEGRRAQVVRWMVSCGSVLLHNKISPYDHFTIVPFFPVFLRGKTSSDGALLIDPQRNYNKLRSQELHIVNGTANSGWKVRNGALKNMTVAQLRQVGSMTGLVLEYEGTSDAIERIEPVQIPQGLDRISQKADSDLGAVSGVQDEARGVARADVAGKAITARKEAMLTSMAMSLENLNRTRKMLVKRILKLVQRYYDEERVLHVTTGGVRPETHKVVLNQYDPETKTLRNDITQGDYNVVITSTAARDTFDNQQFEELKILAELGIPVPPHLFIEHSRLSRREEIAAELKALSGTENPSEEERQLAMEERQVQMEEKKAGVMARQAQAMLSQARAQKIMQEIQGGNLSAKEEHELLLRARELDEQVRSNRESEAIRRGQLRLGELNAVLQDDAAWAQLEQARENMKQRGPQQSADSAGSTTQE